MRSLDSRRRPAVRISASTTSTRSASTPSCSSKDNPEMRYRIVPTPVMLAVVAVVVLFGSACGDSDQESAPPTTAAKDFPTGSTMAQIVDRGKIVIGVKYDVPLFGLVD